ncbi:MAG: ribokinase [Acetobacteraceae bacterium]
MSNAGPVLVIGSLNMDLVARCEPLPQAGQTLFGSDFFTAAGGKGANQAVAAARLGARVAMAGCVGEDQFGSELVAGLRRDAVNTDAVRRVPHPTGTALITVDAEGANTIVVISGANMACDEALVERGLGLAGGPGVLLLQHEIPEAANARAILAARAAGWFIVLNPAPARPVAADMLPLVDLIVPNETEAASLTGSGEPGEAARRLLRRGARGVLVTLGAAGALYAEGGTMLRCPAVAVAAVDTTAAGDSYIGALAAALAEGRAIADSLGFAATAAALAVTRLGAQPSLGTAPGGRGVRRAVRHAGRGARIRLTIGLTSG